jgi:hypothetical protein
MQPCHVEKPQQIRLLSCHDAMMQAKPKRPGHCAGFRRFWFARIRARGDKFIYQKNGSNMATWQHGNHGY